MNTEKRGWILGPVVALLYIAATASIAFGQAVDVRWDLVSLNFAATPISVSAGGIAAARAADNSTIVLTGSGTFVAPAGGGGTSSSVTGGGTWHTFSPIGVSTGSGTYSVTGLVRWEPAPGTFPAGTVDLIGNPADASAGLVVLRIEYSDGSRGTLVVGCNLTGTPAAVLEGATASKGNVDYFNRVPAVAGVNANRTLFTLQ